MPPTHDELWGRARELLPGLKQRAPRCEELRRIPEETLREFHDAELFRLQQPRRVGGAELEFTTIVTCGALLAGACASTSWNWVNFAAHHMMLGMFPPRAQDEIWKESADTLIASSFVFPAAKARKVKDGYVISGRWPFSSGVDPSEWNMLAGLAWLDENAPPEQRVFRFTARSTRSSIPGTRAACAAPEARMSRQRRSLFPSTARSPCPIPRAVPRRGAR
jgi:3-hydroxy-9,10-secoandrosta-1,3,5(10)-triene-9,17-dione monooxygenase